MTVYIAFILWMNVYLVNLINSKSVCDEIAIMCFIDTATIRDSPKDIEQFVDYLVLKGSSEATTLSVIVYGDVPETQFKDEDDIIMIKPQETFNIKKGRKEKRKIIRNKLNFKSILNDELDTKYVSLSDSINIAVTSNEKQTELIIFEHDESAVSEEENCDLIEEYTDNIHFIITDIDHTIDCDINEEERLIYYLSQVKENMEIIYDFSCPTPLMQVTDDEGGDMGQLSLNKHTNIVDLDAIISCDLDYDDDGQLSNDSTISVIDDLEDDMTFDVGEYLVVHKDDYSSLPSDCKYPVFKIDNIESDETNTNLLTLYVSTPPIFEYIPSLHVKVPTVKLQHMHFRKRGNYMRERRKKQNKPNSKQNKPNTKQSKPNTKQRKLLNDVEELMGDSGLYWGDWDTSFDLNSPICDGAPAYCFNLKVDSDGSGANAVRLLCANGVIDQRLNDGPYGDWMEQTLCCSQNNEEGILDNFIIGFRERVEPDQGWWYDDSAVNDIEFMCSDGSLLTSTNGATEGDWSSWKTCSDGKYIAAYDQRVEADQGSGDDSGVNDMNFYCYTKDSEVIYYGASDVNSGMFDEDKGTEIINIDTGLIEYSMKFGGKSTAIASDYGKGSALSLVGTLEVTFGFELEFSLSLKLEFDYSYGVWDGMEINEIRVVFFGDLYVFASFGIDIMGWLQLTVPSLFEFEKITVLWLGFVPVVITPYIQADLILTSPKIGVTLTYDYSYRASDFSFGKVYTATNGWETVDSFPNKEENSNFDIQLAEDFVPDLCDINLSIDGGLQIYFGAKIYEALKTFLRIDLMSSNTLNLPTKCEEDTYDDMCDGDVLKAVVSTRETLTVNVGIGITQNVIFDYIAQYLSGAVLLIPIPGLEGIELYQNEWCFSLDGLLSPINLFFQESCCSIAAESEKNVLTIGYYNEYDDGAFMSMVTIILVLLVINILCMVSSWISSCYKADHSVKYV